MTMSYYDDYEREDLKEDLHEQCDDAERKLQEYLDEIARVNEEIEAKKERDAEIQGHIDNAETLDDWYNAIKTQEIQEIKDRYDVRETMKADRERALSENNASGDNPDDSSTDTDETGDNKSDTTPPPVDTGAEPDLGPTIGSGEVSDEDDSGNVNEDTDDTTATQVEKDLENLRNFERMQEEEEAEIEKEIKEQEEEANTNNEPDIWQPDTETVEEESEPVDEPVDVWTPDEEDEKEEQEEEANTNKEPDIWQPDTETVEEESEPVDEPVDVWTPDEEDEKDDGRDNNSPIPFDIWSRDR